MDSSPLNGLAAELRNSIYEFALVEPYGIRLDVSNRKAKASRTGRVEHDIGPEVFTPPRPSTGLLVACKQTRRETQQIYFSVNPLIAETFCGPYDIGTSGWAFSLSKWALTVNDPLTHIRNINIEIGSMPLRGKIAQRFEFGCVPQIRRLFHADAEVFMTLRIEVKTGMSERLTFPIGDAAKAKENLHHLCDKIMTATADPLSDPLLFEQHSAYIDKMVAVTYLRKEVGLFVDSTAGWTKHEWRAAVIGIGEISTMT